MNIDEMERIAEMYKHLDDPSDPYPAKLVGDLSRALLAMLPVIKAAETWAAIPYQNDPYQNDNNLEECDSKLVAAITTMRARLDGAE